MFFFKFKNIFFYVIFSIFTLFVSNNLYAHGTVTKVETYFVDIYFRWCTTVLLSFIIIGLMEGISGLVDYQKVNKYRFRK